MKKDKDRDRETETESKESMKWAWAYNAVDEFWVGLTNTFDSIVNVNFFVGDQLIHHVH